MAVRIENMDMPKSCYECHLVKEFVTHNAETGNIEPVFRCGLSLKKLCETKRRKDCPLKECE